MSPCDVHVCLICDTELHINYQNSCLYMYMYSICTCTCMYVCACTCCTYTCIPTCILHSCWVGTVLCAICGYTCMSFAIDFAEVSNTVPCHVLLCTFEGAKLLTASMSAVEWCKSHAHTCILFLSEVIQMCICAPTQCERSLVVDIRMDLDVCFQSGPSCVMVGTTKLQFGLRPLMLYNGQVSCQTLTGKISVLKLSTHNFDEEQDITDDKVNIMRAYIIHSCTCTCTYMVYITYMYSTCQIQGIRQTRLSSRVNAFVSLYKPFNYV